MDFAVVAKVLLTLAAIPIVFLVWGVAFMLVDDTFCGSVFQCKIREWVREKMEDKDNE